MNLTGKQSEDRFFLRGRGQNALDSGAFHYSVYHYLTRFLGMSGNLEAGYDLPLDWVNATNQMILTNDLVNPNTGKFDPRHMYGVTNVSIVSTGISFSKSNLQMFPVTFINF